MRRGVQRIVPDMQRPIDADGMTSWTEDSQGFDCEQVYRIDSALLAQSLPYFIRGIANERIYTQSIFSFGRRMHFGSFRCSLPIGGGPND
jgi:hypothetical protein